MLSRSEDKGQNKDQNPTQTQVIHQSLDIERQIVSSDEKLESMNPEMNTTVNPVQQVQHNDCVYIECNPMLDHLPHEQTNFISVHPQHQTIGSMNYNIPHNQIQIGGYALQNVGQVQVYNGTYTLPLQPMSCNQGISQMQVSRIFY